MRRRILAFTSFFLRGLTFSLAGIIYGILALVYWALFFSEGTPDVGNYVLIIGVFGAALAFLSTLSISSLANQASNYPLVVRVPSRVEYLTAVLLSALIFTTLLQLLVGLLALYRGPALALGWLFEIPPVWLSLNVLAAVLALHASDFVTAGWSRVYVFGILAILLFGQSANRSIAAWLGARAGGLSRFFFENDIRGLGQAFNNFAGWVTAEGANQIAEVLGFIFWPFRAMADAVIGGYFTPTQALTPAIILLYATILFMLAADLFATKDLDFIE